MPVNVQELRYNAFEACDKLTSVTILSKNVVFQSEVFARCTMLEKVKFTGLVSSIGYRSFSGCKSLEELVLPEGINDIGIEAFYNCSSLSHIILPNSITGIGEGAFMNCESLEQVNLPIGINGLVTQISLNYVKDGRLTIDEGKLIRQMFNMRHEGDYEDFEETTEEDIQRATPSVKHLVEKLIALNKLA